ncbi:TRAP-like protein, putative [Plasmodium relictum]|uniref:TRAP-like protein, putative n=1 Tax=Plasmodium relictum TaxID=85471 RepID=A0A1J1H8V0_PLARL|nr:TRAP-like protein, putative [Plasmodium relictum]CRH00967.1 TRAP-like protein, putative [Plasmodium relictum]
MKNIKFFNFLFLFLIFFVKSENLIRKITKRGDLDLVLLYDVGIMPNSEINHSLLENIVELGNNILVKNEKKIRISYVTYDHINVKTRITTDNSDANASEKFKEEVLSTKGEYAERGSKHLKALNYIGIKHFFNSNENLTKMVIMFLNSDGDILNDDTDLNTIHYLFDRKNIILNIITNAKFKDYCNYIQKNGSNTNELLKCVYKNSYFHNFILIHTFEKFYDDISLNAVCSEWSEWSQCSSSCNVGSHFMKRKSLKNEKNPEEGLYKRKGKSCLEQRNYIFQECFNVSCDHSLDKCDTELDLSILLDDSTKITLETWKKHTIPSIRKMISHLNVNEKLVNISLTTFSNEVYNWFDFSSILSKDRDELLIFLGYMGYNFGGNSKDINNALQFVHNNVLNTNTTRPDAKKVLLIINSGDIEENSIREVGESIKKIKETYNAEIYSVCINNSYEDQCKKLTISSNENPNDRFSYSLLNHYDLHNEILEIQKNICSHINYNPFNDKKEDEIRIDQNNDNKQKNEEKSSYLDEENDNHNEMLNLEFDVKERTNDPYTLVGESTRSYEDDYLNDDLSRKKKIYFRSELNLNPYKNINDKNLNKNIMVFRSSNNLNEEYENEKIPNSLNTYSSEYKKKGYKKLLNKLLLNMFKKKKKYNIKNFDDEAKNKLKIFIQKVEIRDEKFEDEDEKEKEIEQEFDILLDDLFKNKTDSSDKNIDDYSSNEKEDYDKLEGVLQADMSFSDIYEINRKLLQKVKEAQDKIPEYKYEIRRKKMKIPADEKNSEMNKYKKLEEKQDDYVPDVEDSTNNEKYMHRNKRSVNFENGFDKINNSNSYPSNEENGFNDGVNVEKEVLRVNEDNNNSNKFGDTNNSSSNIFNESSTNNEFTNILNSKKKQEENKNDNYSNDARGIHSFNKNKSNCKKRILTKNDYLRTKICDMNKSEYPKTLNSRELRPNIMQEHILDALKEKESNNIEGIKLINNEKENATGTKKLIRSNNSELDTVYSKLKILNTDESYNSSNEKSDNISTGESKTLNNLESLQTNIGESRPINAEKSQSISNENPKSVSIQEPKIRNSKNTNSINIKDIEQLDTEDTKKNYDNENIKQNNEEGGKDNHNHDHKSSAHVYKYAAAFAVVAFVSIGASMYYLYYRKHKGIVRSLDSNEFSVSSDIKELKCKEQNVNLNEEHSWN